VPDIPLFYFIVSVSLTEWYTQRRWKWQEDEEEDVRSYWMTLRTGEDTLI